MGAFNRLADNMDITPTLCKTFPQEPFQHSSLYFGQLSRGEVSLCMEVDWRRWKIDIVRASITLQTLEGVAHRDLQLGDPNDAHFLFLFSSSTLTVVAVDSSPAVSSRLDSVGLDEMFVPRISSRQKKNKKTSSQ